MTQTTLREYLRTTEDAISSGRIEEAMANCQNILTYFPEALEAQRLLGEVYLAQGQMEEAQQTFEWILTNDPENVIVYCDRALISERTSDVDTALDCYQQAYELSRGSSDIRQQFNQLSARAGQQEFMFSRAGLARLYMRGDLLTQAMQEWDAVLAISPDRLDARLGLMETYWREGTYDKTEQVAMQLLEEVPTCLKALLFLAHVASISNTPRARDLLVRAEALDPELTMAQEVFADLAASQPGDPFLALLKREPIVLENGRPVTAQSVSTPAQKPQPTSAPLEQTYGNWDPLDNWERQTQSSAPLNHAPSASPSHLSQNGMGEDFSAFNPHQPEMPATWVSQLEQQSPTSPNEPTWYQQNTTEDWNNEIPGAEMGAAPPAWLGTLTRSEQEQTLSGASASTQREPSAPLSIPSASAFQAPAVPEPVAQQSEAAPVPEKQAQSEDEPMPFFFPSDEESEGEMGWPEWLKSLGAEELEPEQPAPPSAPLPEIAPVPSKPLVEAPPRAESQPSQPLPEVDPWASLPSISANNDAWADSNSQPDWMQQIAPVEIPAAQSATPDWMQQVTPVNSAPSQDAAPEWMQQFSPIENTPSQNAAPEWMQQFSPVENTPSQNAAPEWMQQFSPVENISSQDAAPEWMQSFANTSSQSQPQNQSSSPDWMQQLSNAESQLYQEPAVPAGTPANEQEQRYLASLEDLEKDLQSQGFVQMEPGSLASIAQTQTNTPVQPQQESRSSLSSALAQLGNFAQPPAAPNSNEPWWNSQNREQPMPAIPHTPGESLNPFAALGARTNEDAPRPFAPLPATPAPFAQSPNAGQQLTPTYRSDALLDSDLETTMKRPAITLQPMKKGDGRHHERSGGTNGKGRGGERRPTDHLDESNLSNHERLIKGYQYQLSGAYEESMQEYRLIIRNAPELLEDVISNLRALLKINPRFSLGYRVLGDAYMRKGEYLQAMESYNKALTMAKKAKN
jgi:tetratricopeptide (TPR) repeat protein